MHTFDFSPKCWMTAQNHRKIDTTGEHSFEYNNEDTDFIFCQCVFQPVFFKYKEAFCKKKSEKKENASRVI